MIGITSIHNTVADWFARVAVRAPLTQRPVVGRAFEAEELGAFHQSLHAAYRTFARQHPAWTQRGFDEAFLCTDALTPLLICWVSDGTAQPTPTGMDLARMWERKYGVLLCGAERVTEVVRLAEAANGLLTVLGATRR